MGFMKVMYVFDILDVIEEFSFLVVKFYVVCWMRE